MTLGFPNIASTYRYYINKIFRQSTPSVIQNAGLEFQFDFVNPRLAFNFDFVDPRGEFFIDWNDTRKSDF